MSRTGTSYARSAQRHRKAGHVVTYTDAAGRHVLTTDVRRSLAAVIEGLRLLLNQPARIQLFSGDGLEAFKEKSRGANLGSV